MLPVVPRAITRQTINESLVKSYLRNKMEKIQLTKNMRAQSDTNFAKYLLKIGNGTIILLRNLDPSNGLCNGTRKVCREFHKNIIYAEIAIDKIHELFFLPQIPMSPANDEGYPFKFKRKRFPIKLCFAMTINKA